MNPRSLHITVMLGGPSGEREVSLWSGAAAVKALRSLGHTVHQLDPREPTWELPAVTEVVFLALHGPYGEDGTVQEQLEKLGKINASTGHRSSSETAPPADTDNSAPTPVGPQTGHPYIIASGDTLAAIAKAYRAQGVKVSVKDILAANPGLDPNKLYVGKKIFIPDPSAK